MLIKFMVKLVFDQQKMPYKIQPYCSKEEVQQLQSMETLCSIKHKML